jgi:drug/metabolite transporter (DMT)-like permease
MTEDYEAKYPVGHCAHRSVLPQQTGFWTVSAFRGMTGGTLAVTAAAFSKTRKGSIMGERRNLKWLLLRGLLGGITIISNFAAITVGDCTLET